MIAFAYISSLLTTFSIILAIHEYSSKGMIAHVFVGMGWLFINLIGIAAIYWR